MAEGRRLGAALREGGELGRWLELGCVDGAKLGAMLRLGETLKLGLSLGSRLGLSEGDTDGRVLGAELEDGDEEACLLGEVERETEGCVDGRFDGGLVGNDVGLRVGLFVGDSVGAKVGLPVVGETLGFPLVTVGPSVVGDNVDGL